MTDQGAGGIGGGLAREAYRAAIHAKRPSEVEALVAALLRGMGYYTPAVSIRDTKGGVDLLAYRDPLGMIAPRMQVQIKHRDDAVSVQEILRLIGTVAKDGDAGVFISTGGFTSEAKAVASSSRARIELMDADRVIDLWQEFYPKLSAEDKKLMPLVPINFPAPRG